MLRWENKFPLGDCVGQKVVLSWRDPVRLAFSFSNSSNKVEMETALKNNSRTPEGEAPVIF